MNVRTGILPMLTIFLALTATACSPAGEPRGASPSADPLVLRVFAQQNADQNLATNDFTKQLESRFNVRFDWDLVPYDGAKEKRQISLAGGHYDDAYILTAYIDQFSQADVLRYGKQGVFVPLNDLIGKYAPHIRDALANNPDLRAFSTAPDGNIYGLVDYSECYHCSYPNKMWLNTKWLDRLHLDMPRTTEQFKQVLEAFKTRDPNGNGLADEVPLSGSTEDFGVHVIPFLMNGFIYDDDQTYLQLVNGKAEMVANQERWKEGLAYIKSLYDEGLIDPGAFTQNADAYKMIGENDGAQILGAGAAMHPAIFVDTGQGNTRGSDYNPVPPLVGPYGSYAVYKKMGILPGAKFVITDRASEAERIALIRMVDYMFTPEGQAFAEIGKEGVEWRRPLPGEKGLDEAIQPSFATIPLGKGEKPRNSGWGGMGHFYMPKSYRDSWVQGMDIYAPDGYERRLFEATGLYDGKQSPNLYPTWSVWIDSSQADEASILQTNLKYYIEQNALEFITGDKNLDSDWDSYVKGFGDLGLSSYLAIMQQAYDASLRLSRK
ncbi:extracellular solute-binding protein [Cohnella zeiphila]|uniref:Extracellular solute-binding protein n=1 Tax=Cohnella zeiphila TaxID=2761120 RepID=A0A7X0SRV8_9BACL|nr:extracellular solute-binding protein [Cohnella zeiphila]MBB6735005.1 extracellular solute-binding protein [Cohnella zeiphila]